MEGAGGSQKRLRPSPERATANSIWGIGINRDQPSTSPFRLRMCYLSDHFHVFLGAIGSTIRRPFDRRIEVRARTEAIRGLRRGMNLEIRKTQVISMRSGGCGG
jgi:hypothetical protein